MSTPQQHESTNGSKNKIHVDEVLTVSEMIRVWHDWVKHYWDTPRVKSSWTDILQVLIGTIVAVAAIASAWMFQQQLVLMRDQLEGTQAAVVYLLVQMESNGNGVQYSFQNSGASVAQDVTGKIAITRQRLPDLQEIGNRQEIEIPPEPLKPTSPFDGGARQDTIAMRAFGRDDWAAIQRNEQTIRLEWEGSYANGFGRLVKIPKKCKQVLAIGQGMNHVNCDEFADKLKEALESKRKLEGSNIKGPK